MKVVVSHETWDFAKVEKIFYRESVFGHGYPIEVRMVKSGFFSGSEEIVRVTTEECAKQLVFAISEAWASGEVLFNVNDWLAKHSFTVWAPKPSSWELERQNKVKNFVEQTKQDQQLISELDQNIDDIRKLFQDKKSIRK